MLKKAAALFLVGTSLAMWVGCTTSSSLYLYATVPVSNQIVAYREDPNAGVLTVLAGSPITAGPAVQSIVIHPSKKFLYTANSGESDVSRFLISSDGALSEQTPRTPVGTAPTVLAMDSAGAFLYVANSGSNTISAFSISASDGSLMAVGAPVPTGVAPLNMKVAPSGNFLYVTGSGSPQGYIEVFSLAGGVATFVQYVQPGTNPYGLAISPAGTFLYTANTGDNSISEYSIDPTLGTLTQITGSPLGESYSAPLSLLVDASGKYLFVANEGSNNLAGYGIGSDGGLTVLANSPFGTAAEPSFVASDAAGRYVFVGNQKGGAIQSYSLDGSTGTLTSIATYAVGNTPTSIAVTP